MDKPHCYGEMLWTLKYPKDKMSRESICDCEYKNSCLQITRNREEIIKNDKYKI